MDNDFETLEYVVHGSPEDRGSADYYYYRNREPHYWPEGTGNGTKVENQKRNRYFIFWIQKGT